MGQKHGYDPLKTIQASKGYSALDGGRIAAPRRNQGGACRWQNEISKTKIIDCVKGYNQNITPAECGKQTKTSTGRMVVPFDVDGLVTKSILQTFQEVVCRGRMTTKIVFWVIQAWNPDRCFLNMGCVAH